MATPHSPLTGAGETGLREPAIRLSIDTFINAATAIWNNKQGLRVAPTLGPQKEPLTQMRTLRPSD